MISGSKKASGAHGTISPSVWALIKEAYMNFFLLKDEFN
jgi:hypothetical protein